MNILWVAASEKLQWLRKETEVLAEDLTLKIFWNLFNN